QGLRTGIERMPHAFLCHPANVSLPEPVRLVPFYFYSMQLSSQCVINAKKKPHKLCGFQTVDKLEEIQFAYSLFYFTMEVLHNLR
ncbi:hypothetical protein ACFRFG_18790, partial [Bacillus safensis]|uniref:hypothetical protein n=1 Tax=Bacillus safensis TaxID=561879 RepID=UPI00366B86A4